MTMMMMMLAKALRRICGDGLLYSPREPRCRARGCGGVGRAVVLFVLFVGCCCCCFRFVLVVDCAVVVNGRVASVTLSEVKDDDDVVV